MRRLSSNGSDWLEPYRRDPVRHRLTHPEGYDYDSWLIEGRDAPRPGPVVIQIHGGPHAAHGPTPWLEMLALADEGFHVLYPNPRGSSGYGEAFAKAIYARWGEVDGSEHLHLAQWAVESGLADPERIGVMGLSGGGYMTNWLLGLLVRRVRPLWLHGRAVRRYRSPTGRRRRLPGGIAIHEDPPEHLAPLALAVGG